MSGGRLPTPRCDVDAGPLRERGTRPMRGTVCDDRAAPKAPPDLNDRCKGMPAIGAKTRGLPPAEPPVIPPPPPPPLAATPGTAMGHAASPCGRRSPRSARIDGRLLRACALVSARADRGEAASRVHRGAPAGERAGGPAAPNAPCGRRRASAQRAKGIADGWTRGSRATSSASRGSPADDQRRYVEHLAQRVRSGGQRHRQVPGASTLKAAILLDVERRSGDGPSASLAASPRPDDPRVERHGRRTCVSHPEGGGSADGVHARPPTPAGDGADAVLPRRPYIVDAVGPASPAIPISDDSRSPGLHELHHDSVRLARIQTAIHRGCAALYLAPPAIGAAPPSRLRSSPAGCGCATAASGRRELPPQCAGGAQER